MEFCAKMLLCIGNTYFKLKYTRAGRRRDILEVKSIVGLMLEKRDMLKYD